MPGIKFSGKGNVNVGSDRQSSQLPSRARGSVSSTADANAGHTVRSTGRGVAFNGRGNVVVSRDTTPSKIGYQQAKGSKSGMRNPK